MLVNSLNLSNKLYYITVPWTATQAAHVLNNGKGKKNDGKDIKQAKFQLICKYTISFHPRSTVLTSLLTFKIEP